jgi:hypothetical protein
MMKITVFLILKERRDVNQRFTRELLFALLGKLDRRDVRREKPLVFRGGIEKKR